MSDCAVKCTSLTLSDGSSDALTFKTTKQHPYVIASYCKEYSLYSAVDIGEQEIY